MSFHSDIEVPSNSKARITTATMLLMLRKVASISHVHSPLRYFLGRLLRLRLGGPKVWDVTGFS